MEIFKFSKIGKDAYKELDEHYKPSTPLESAMIQMLAKAIEIAGQSDADMKKKGTVQQFKTGARQISPEFQVFQKSIEAVQELAAQIDKTYESAEKGKSKAVKSILDLAKKAG